MFHSLTRESERMVRGRVKWFNENKVYGRIGHAAGPDVSVHYSAICGEGFRTLEEGQMVAFEIIEETGGPRAAHVVPLD